MISIALSSQHHLLENLTNDCELFSLEGKTLDAKVVEVKDGDTIMCCFSLNNMTPKKWCIRMHGYDSCEVHTKDKLEKLHGIATTLMLTDRILNKIVQITFGPADKYGRWLAIVRENEENINEWVLQNSPSVPYFGKHKEKNFDYNCISPIYLKYLSVSIHTQKNSKIEKKN
jgi:endonuclease YncB( thermonuclease family)